MRRVLGFGREAPPAARLGASDRGQARAGRGADAQDEDEERRLLEAAEHSGAPHLKSAILLALHTGARRGEIARLKWSQVDLEGETITINETKNDRLLSARRSANIGRAWRLGT